MNNLRYTNAGIFLCFLFGTFTLIGMFILTAHAEKIIYLGSTLGLLGIICIFMGGKKINLDKILNFIIMIVSSVPLSLVFGYGIYINFHSLIASVIMSLIILVGCWKFLKSIGDTPLAP